MYFSSNFTDKIYMNMKFHILFFICCIYLISSCSDENFEYAITEVLVPAIDTTYISTGEVSFKYQGDNVKEGCKSFVCEKTDPNNGLYEQDYLITNAEYIEEDNLIILDENSLVLSYSLIKDLLIITLVIEEDSVNRILQSVLANASNIILEDIDNVIQGSWIANFDDITDPNKVLPVGEIEGSFFVPKILHCE